MRHAAFDMFLDRLDPSQRQDQLAFFRVLAATGPEGLSEVGSRIQRVSCPLALRQLALEFSYYYPWPEWVPLVDRLLKHEKELALFETGVRALGRMRTPESLEALRSLSLSRATPGFREILAQVLQETDPAEAFEHHFSRLLKGSAQPEEANEGAHQLAGLLNAESLEPLKACVSHPDPMVFRHALRLICQIPSAATAEYLLDCFESTHRDALDNREARLLLNGARALPHPEVQAKALQALSARWLAKAPEALALLESGQAAAQKQGIEALRASATGLLDTFLLDTYQAALVEKPTHLAKFLTQAGDEAQQRTRRIDFVLDISAQGLASLAQAGHIDGERVRPALAASLRESTGNAGVAAALARLLPPGDEASLELLVTQAEGVLRSAAVEVLGQRREPAFLPAFLRLRRDPIAEIADRSLWHLGQLPDAEGNARRFLANPDPDELQVGLRFVAMHRLLALVPDLLALAEQESREAVLMATLHTLGELGAPESLEPLLALLHSGQGPRIQVALGEAIRGLGSPAAALALASKAQEMRSPTLHTQAVEAFAKAHGDPANPLPASSCPIFLQALRTGWSDRQPWPLRRRLADALLLLQAEDSEIFTEAIALIQTTLAEKRNPGAVATEDLAHLNSCARALARKTGA